MTQLSLTTTGRTGYGAQRRSPSAMAAAVVFNGGMIALLLALPAAQIIADGEEPLPVTFVDIDPVPPENKPEPVKELLKTQKSIPQPEQPFIPPTEVQFEGTKEIAGTQEILPPVAPFVKPVGPVTPVHVPVFTGAIRDPRFADAFTPPYPPDLVRQELEGSVTVRITINEQGRVIACDLVKATNRAFYDETREQALRRWRFRPATSDGVPVQSQQTLTVHFQLDA